MKILNEVIKFGKSFGQLTQVAQFAVVIALVFVAFSVGSCESKTTLDKFIVEYEELQKNAKQTTRYADSLDKKVALLSDSAAKQDEKIKKLTISVSFREEQKLIQSRQLARLEDRVKLAKADSNLVTVVAIQDTVIDNLKTQLTTTEQIVDDQKEIIKTQSIQVLTLQEAVLLAQARGDTLQKIIDKLPPAPTNPNKFFFGLIPKPSRTVVGIVSLAAGVVIGSQVGR